MTSLPGVGSATATGIALWPRAGTGWPTQFSREQLVFTVNSTTPTISSGTAVFHCGVRQSLMPDLYVQLQSVYPEWGEASVGDELQATFRVQNWGGGPASDVVIQGVRNPRDPVPVHTVCTRPLASDSGEGDPSCEVVLLEAGDWVDATLIDTLEEGSNRFALQATTTSVEDDRLPNEAELHMGVPPEDDGDDEPGCTHESLSTTVPWWWGVGLVVLVRRARR